MTENESNVLILIKPDAILRGLVGQILAHFEQRGFWINSLVTRFKNLEALGEIFEGVYSSEGYKEYLNQPMIGFLLYCKNGPYDCMRIDNLIGNRLSPTDCSVGTLREMFGTNHVNNAVSSFQQQHRIDIFYDPKTDLDIRSIVCANQDTE